MTGPVFDIAAVKAGVSLAEIVKAAGVDLKRRGAEFIGRCPFHEDRSPSFSVFKKQGKDFYKCFGCGASGDVITFMTEYHGLSTFEALKQLSGSHNAPQPRGGMPVSRGAGGAVRPDEDEARRVKRKRAAARALWDAAVAVTGPLQAYLSARGITAGPLPKSLRFHPAIEYWDDETGEVLGTFPAMLAPVYNARHEFIALHRTYLKPDCSAKADVPKPKKVLGSFAGGFIPLYPIEGGEMNIAEGIETALAVRMHHATGGFWTCISLGNLGNLAIPPQVTQVNIWADNDMAAAVPGKRDLRQQIREAARKFRQAQPGRTVRIHWPPDGKDFNDVIAGGAP